MSAVANRLKTTDKFIFKTNRSFFLQEKCVKYVSWDFKSNDFNTLIANANKEVGLWLMAHKYDTFPLIIEEKFTVLHLYVLI